MKSRYGNLVGLVQFLWLDGDYAIGSPAERVRNLQVCRWKRSRISWIGQLRSRFRSNIIRVSAIDKSERGHCRIFPADPAANAPGTLLCRYYSSANRFKDKIKNEITEVFTSPFDRSCFMIIGAGRCLAIIRFHCRLDAGPISLLAARARQDSPFPRHLALYVSIYARIER